MLGFPVTNVQKGLIALALLVGCASAPLEPEPARPPNVVILFADDLGYGSVSWTGGNIPTPNIDSIVDNGIGFTAGYMTAPVCNPSRPGLMAGRYQQRWGKELNSQTVPPVNAPFKHLPLTETTIATAMKKQGYATGAVGKWQLGMTDGYHPLDRGFDFFLGLPSGCRFVETDWPNARILPGQEEEAPELGVKDSSGRLRQPHLGREPIPLSEYMTDMFGKAAVKFIDEHKEEPFFLYTAFHAPHGPIQTIDKYYDMVPQFEDEGMRIYAGMITAVDFWVGEVLAKLREHGLEENTLVIFTADNGAMQTSDFDGKRNYPFIGHKRNLYEGGIRVPYAMQWKGKFDGGWKFDLPVNSLDIFPTVASAPGGVDLSEYHLDGVDLVPYLTGKKQGAPHEHLVWRSGPNRAVRKGPWKLFVSDESDIVRLYNVDEDPSESNDRAAKNPEKVEELKAIFDQWKTDKADQRESSRKFKTKFNGDMIDWHI